MKKNKTRKQVLVCMVSECRWIQVIFHSYSYIFRRSCESLRIWEKKRVENSGPPEILAVITDAGYIYVFSLLKPAYYYLYQSISSGPPFLFISYYWLLKGPGDCWGILASRPLIARLDLAFSGRFWPDSCPLLASSGSLADMARSTPGNAKRLPVNGLANA